MDLIRTWVLPPLIGAIIGYFTNWLAIKMLFRPYRTIRVAGIRLPFTPGILPRERDRLAESLGETVAQELLTPQVISMRMQSPEIRATAESAIRIALGGFLGQSAEHLFPDASDARAGAGDISAEHDGKTGMLSGPSGGSSLSAQLLQSLQQLVASVEVQASIKNVLSAFLRRVGEMELGRLVSRDQFTRSIVGAAEVLEARTAEPQGSASRCSEPHRLLGAAVELPPDITVKALADALIPRAYEIALPHIGAFLRSDEFTARLETEAHAFVKRALGRLGPMQRLFVSLAGYDAKIAQTMPETIDDLIETIEHILHDPIAPTKVSEAICAVIIAQRAHGAATEAETNVDPSRGFIISSLPAVLQSLSGAHPELCQRAERVYDRLAGAKVHDILGMPISAEDVSDLAVSAFVRTMEQGLGTASTLGDLFVQVLRESSRGKSIAEFFGIGEKDIAQISSTLSSALLSLIQNRMPLLVEAIDIRSMVAERIDGLDMKEIERIVLQVVKKELAWITWLGGILGALIGFIQSLISIF